MKAFVFCAVFFAGSVVSAQRWVMMVPTVQVVEVQPVCVYQTRRRPFLGGWVTRGQLIWAPVQQQPPKQPQTVLVPGASN